jgi:hypothetical protein
MAIPFPFIGIIVRIDAINAKCQGGLRGCLSHVRWRAIKPWHDEFLLYGGGAMDGLDIPEQIEWWKKQGLNTHREIDGMVLEWIDLCVCEELDKFPLFNCKWLYGDPRRGGVYLAGTEPGMRVMPTYEFETSLEAKEKAEKEDERNGPLWFARAAEKERLDGLGLPPAEHKRRMDAWSSDFVERNRPFIEQKW